MRTLTNFLVMFALVAAAPGIVDAQSSRGRDGRSSNDSGFSDYEILIDRNIFDSTRRANRRPEPERPTFRPPPEVVERISLSGVFINQAQSANEAVAFFTGSSSEYNGSAKLGGEIAGFKVAEIRTDRVRLVKDEKSYEVPITMGISRRNRGEWQLAGPVYTERPRSSSFASGGSSRRGSSRFGSDRRGSDQRGFDRGGNDRGGFDFQGFNPQGFDFQGFNPQGFGQDDADVANSDTTEPSDDTASEGESAEDMLRQLMERRRREMEP